MDFAKRMEILDLSTQLEEKAKFNKRSKLIPIIEWPPEVKVKFDTPWGGAAARFRMYSKDESSWVSFYLDTQDVLGSHGGQPYWEMYPNEDGDTSRCGIEDLQDLINEAAENLTYVD